MVETMRNALFALILVSAFASAWWVQLPGVGFGSKSPNYNYYYPTQVYYAQPYYYYPAYPTYYAQPSYGSSYSTSYAYAGSRSSYSYSSSGSSYGSGYYPAYSYPSYNYYGPNAQCADLIAHGYYVC
ncbi:hypothetical protein COU39_03790 [Candidatus Micrarchaeota archaeon CG10_big_fil_rev_8_21_14_0_10_60_32]|nr:MAG: hypothetical protein AUJ16_04000 [Candidatus Micrarchaeota archaeon CG1_02_60_51]PIN95851.1 MAG: hypothetical protein COU39_03790 [Candidatus Micrarchaeota archaeon CG10_big_fil_rev_8_21_14_0_10_60_32]PIY91873.1 MAG: hypothetical protein COY71_00815 [Candidatus Micrarchaeota archaeon CG_4_10_14_0_8_um_filter_60_7]